MGDLNRNEDRIVIRDARPDDAPFLAKCIMAGMHFYDFESGIPEEDDLFRRLTACERRESTTRAGGVAKDVEVGFYVGIAVIISCQI